MKKQPIIIFSGVIMVVLLFFFGRTTDNKPESESSAAVIPSKKFDIHAYIDSSRLSLNSEQVQYISKLENDLKIGGTQPGTHDAFLKLAEFWKDSARNFNIYAFYTSEAAKLDNSEKNLTFAGHLFLDRLRIEQDIQRLDWQTEQAADLFQRAMQINPENDDIKIGLGSVYIFGKGRSGNPDETMKGVQQVLSVVRKDSNNMKAHLVLGIGGFISGQYEKAIERFHKVVAREPGNLEAVAFLADSYAAVGNRNEAIKWYTLSKRLANNPHYSAEVDARIRELK